MLRPPPHAPRGRYGENHRRTSLFEPCFENFPALMLDLIFIGFVLRPPQRWRRSGAVASTGSREKSLGPPSRGVVAASGRCERRWTLSEAARVDRRPNRVTPEGVEPSRSSGAACVILNPSCVCHSAKGPCVPNSTATYPRNASRRASRRSRRASALGFSYECRPRCPPSMPSTCESRSARRSSSTTPPSPSPAERRSASSG